MKTSKELSQEIMEKIKTRDEARLQFRKHARRWFAFACIFGFLIPTSVFFVTNECFSRDPQFNFPFAEERPFLRPLLPRPFELASWKIATVGPNYHISVEHMNYSVPFEYIKQKVDDAVRRKKSERRYRQWVERLRDKAVIRTFI